MAACLELPARYVVTSRLPPFAELMRSRPIRAAVVGGPPSRSRQGRMIGRRNAHTDQFLDVTQERRLLGITQRDRHACT